ncbi:MAG: carboxypeptidase-like regulatory domain-containing protein [Bacteroidota bacterium]
MNQTPTLIKGISCLLLSLFISTLSAQQASIVGLIEEATSKEPLTGITVFIESISKGSATDFDGRYQIQGLKAGTYQLSISGIGYAQQLQEVVLTKGQKFTLNIALSEEAQQLNEVVVRAKSNEQLRREEPIKVEVISVEKVLEQSSSLPELINQTSGVKVRQASGVGSSTTININGLQGNAVRYFKDGIPTDYLGYAFNIGLVPTGSIKNIEIFKGVLPIELGADALGGAINIVTKSKDKQYLDASYEVGQFNTHLVNVNGNFIIPNTKIHVGASSYLSHSDNDYEFDLDVTDFNGVTQRNTFRRFHDAITARFVEGNVGVHNTSWADLLDFKVAYFSLDNEVQHGIRITQPFGEVVQSQTNKIISLNYVKEIAPNLHLNAFGAMADRNSTDQDLSAFLYDWTGEQSQPTPAGEVRLRDQVFDEETKVARLNLRYEINDQFNPKALQIFDLASMNRTGEIDITDEMDALVAKMEGVNPDSITYGMGGFMLERDGKFFTQLFFTDKSGIEVVDKTFVGIFDVATDELDKIIEWDDFIRIGYFSCLNCSYATIGDDNHIYLASFIGNFNDPEGPNYRALRIKSGETDFDRTWDLNGNRDFPAGENFALGSTVMNGKMYVKMFDALVDVTWSLLREKRYYAYEIDIASKTPKKIEDIPAAYWRSIHGPTNYGGKPYFIVENSELDDPNDPHQGKAYYYSYDPFTGASTLEVTILNGQPQTIVEF